MSFVILPVRPLIDAFAFFFLLWAQAPQYSVTSIVDGLKRLYIEKLKPLEVAYRFNDFVSPLLVSEIEEARLTVPHNCLLSSIFGAAAVIWIACSVLFVLSISSFGVISYMSLQTNSDFDAKPMVMLLGQYSTGKTTFIKHLLKGEYPG